MINIDEIIDEFKQRAVIPIERAELPRLLDQALVVKEVDTHISGWIRILDLDGIIILEEETTEGEVLLRRFKSVEMAASLIEDRLATYERMWDGCGCRIDYHAKT